MGAGFNEHADDAPLPSRHGSASARRQRMEMRLGSPSTVQPASPGATVEQPRRSASRPTICLEELPSYFDNDEDV
jgi:hypothetical protein